MSTVRPLRVLVADDEWIVAQTLCDYLRDLGHRVDEVGDGDAALQLIEKEDHDLAFVDVRMPRIDGLTVLSRVHDSHPELSVVMITGHGSMEMAIRALRLGAADFLTKPIKLRDVDAVLEKALRIRSLRQEKFRLRDTIRGLQSSESLRENRALVGRSPATQKVREQIRQAVEADCPTILVTGDTGTGKEVVAREIHFQAGSEDRPFIAVSCPALPDTLVESELFGHVKGAFTGATHPKAGYFELANGGTLFLDEVGDLSPAAQATLLRVLETRAVRRLGGAREIEVDLRVVAATNLALDEGIAGGTFRRDLFYRLNVFAIHLLPLRERREDVMPLAEHFLEAYCAPRRCELDGFTPQARAALERYDYPGNARELRNIVERAAILRRHGQIQLGDLAFSQDAEPTDEPAEDKDQDPERAAILKALEHHRWNRREAARALGMPYSTLRYKIAKLGIS